MSSNLHAPRPAGRRWPIRIALAAVALAALVPAVEHFLAWERSQREITALLADTGLDVRQPRVADDALRDSDPEHGRLAIARALLAESFDASPFSRLPLREAIEQASRVPERLEIAREIARKVMAARPASWEAALVLGGATYRLWSVRGDRRLFTDRAAWEKPLREASVLAPGEEEPDRMLAWAYLELWPYATETEHAPERAVLRTAFADPPTFQRLAPEWLAVAADREQALSLVPDTPEAWTVVERVWTARDDWAGACIARDRWQRALHADLTQRLDELAARRRGGDLAGARAVALGILDEAPPGRGFAEIVERALALLPPGAASGGGSPGLERWLEWALQGAARGDTRLTPATMARLELASGQLPAAERALAALARGDLPAAEIAERRSEALNTEAWAPYFLAKARLLAAAGQAAAARDALRRVNRSWRGSVAELEARVAVARAGGDASTLADARAALEAAAATSWQGTAWVWHAGVASLDLLPAAPADGLAIELDVVPEKGAAVEVRVDGGFVECVPVTPHDVIRFSVPLDRGPHLVEVRSIAGGSVVPGDVALVWTRPTAPPAADPSG